MTNRPTRELPWRPSQTLTWAASLLTLVIVPAAILWPARTAGPVADDFFFLSSVDLSSVGPSFVSGWGHTMGSSAGLRPMTLLSYAIDHGLHPRDPAGYRLTNFVLHGMNAALLALVLSGLSVGRPAALIAGLLFALHPAHHENVLWISGRPYMVGAFFGLLTMWSAFWPTSAIRRAVWRGALWQTLTMGLALAALLSYEAMIVLVPFAAAMAAFSSRMTARTVAIACAPLVAATGLYLLWRFLLVSGVHQDLRYLVSSDSWQTSALNLRHASLRLFACGACSRSRAPLTSVTFLLSLGGTAAAILLVRDRLRVLAAACAVSLIAFLPFLVAGGYADRFVYLATLAPPIVLGLGAVTLRLRARRVRVVVFGVVAAIALLWSRQLMMLARDWVAAGDLAREMTQRLEARVQPLAPASALHVFDLPVFVGDAIVFPTYFSLAVQQQLDRPTLAIYERGSSAVPGAIQRALDDRSPDDFVLRWVGGATGWDVIAAPPTPNGSSSVR